MSQPSSAILPLDEYKSIFYQLNAKPDTEIRLLSDGRTFGKTLELADIISINERIGSKLKNHDITADITSLNFILTNKKIKDYSSWAEFDREKWDTVNEKIESFTINWDILIKLPQYQLPQRHSIKLRIGTVIPPKDVFQLLLTSDDVLELLETTADGICKIDFINNILAIELLNIISNWYEGLKESPKPNIIHRFLKSQGSLVSEIIRCATPILLLIIAYIYSEYLFIILGIKKDISIDNFFIFFILLITIFTFGSFVGRKIERSIDRKINKFEEYPKFSITRGDKKAIEDYEKNNKKLTMEIATRIFWILFSMLFSFIFKLFIQHI
ncbi:hypothetical protein [Anabaena azotica]|uniref:Uncharacterized protein n=1 Tax=Anabaena azotica FACHB-119 TaxID=947527 RepID=A0ABR8D5R3_9NOST|nr:hypothetical protein [Anabaena azotica]MBD2501650.1 hypothetical protein [Anabaena azotica FACHB-119]